MFPSVLNTFNRPSATDRLNNPSHSALHNTVSSALGQVQAVIGVEGDNSVVGSLEYLIKSPASDGGGHVQSAVKGGTGQITFTKGNLLVATNATTLTKLAVGSEGEVLRVTGGAATGVSWSSVVANKVAVKTTSVAYGVSTTSTAVLFSASILGSTLGTNNAIKFTGAIRNFSGGAGGFVVTAHYGGNSVLTVAPVSAGSIIGARGTLQGIIAGNGAITSQVGYMTWNTSREAMTGQGPGVGELQPFLATAYGSSSINSSANQDLIIYGQFTGSSAVQSVVTGLFVVEKIV